MRQQLPSDQQLVWEKRRSQGITSDVIWKLDAYRAALFLLHVARADNRALLAAYPADDIARQLIRAAGSTSANVAEGYSRATRADRLRFLDYALGSTRECVTWYEAVRDSVLPDALIEERLQLLMRIRALLLGLIRSFRERKPSIAFDP
ncbi:MAG TPA: four helix bundle protein [Gemmatimonadaceae bacterium]|nr:four helix bundle protein [Gemmatimonadaceae bacterium]